MQPGKNGENAKKKALPKQHDPTYIETAERGGALGFPKQGGRDV
jgi:hypothetical protein